MDALEKFANLITKYAPVIQDCPGWVRLYFVSWVVLSAGLLASIALTYKLSGKDRTASIAPVVSTVATVPQIQQLTVDSTIFRPKPLDIEFRGGRGFIKGDVRDLEEWCNKIRTPSGGGSMRSYSNDSYKNYWLSLNMVLGDFNYKPDGSEIASFTLAPDERGIKVRADFLDAPFASKDLGCNYAFVGQVKEFLGPGVSSVTLTQCTVLSGPTGSPPAYLRPVATIDCDISSIERSFANRTTVAGLAQFDAVYAGKWFEVNAVVADIVGTVGAVRSIGLKLDVTSLLGKKRYQIVGSFESEWDDLVQSVRPGDNVHLRGLMSSFSEQTLYLTNCEFFPDMLVRGRLKQ